MKLRFIKGIRPGQSSMVAHTRYGNFSFTALGESQEVDDTAGHEILSRWPANFEQVRQGRPPKDYEGKMVRSYENKALEAEE